MNRYVLVVAVFLTVFVSGAGWYFSQNLERYAWPILIPKEYQWQSDKTKTARIQIGEHTFDFPLAYIGGRASQSQKDHTILLVYMLPDFKARSDFSSREEYDKAFQDRKFGQVYVDDNSTKTEFNKLRAKYLAKIENSISYIDNVSFDAPPGLVAEHWYRVITAGQNKGQRRLERDMFFEYDENKRIKSYIECDRESEQGERRRPVCSHRFIYKNLYFDTSYNRAKYLASWKERQQAAINFVFQFEAQPKPQEKTP